MKNTKPGNCPQVKSCKTGNLKTGNVGDSPGAMGAGKSTGRMKAQGSYTTGAAPGTDNAK